MSDDRIGMGLVPLEITAASSDIIEPPHEISNKVVLFVKIDPRHMNIQ